MQVGECRLDKKLWTKNSDEKRSAKTVDSTFSMC